MIPKSKERIEVENIISRKILETVDDSPNMSRGDLQGVVESLACRLYDVVKIATKGS